jgi:mRNA-degrading endonuclease RelE of RelBE toxin-antitoxin system
MARRPPYSVDYAPIVRDQIRGIRRRDFAFIKEAIEANLFDEPDTETANRKPLAPTTELEAEWELRCGPNNRFRVFYSVDQQRRQVHIVAIGVKRGNRLKIGRNEVSL